MLYDDFNPFLDRFRNWFSRRRKAEKVLEHLRLWDHMDGVLVAGRYGNWSTGCSA